MKTILIYKKSNLLNTAGGIEKMLSWLANALNKKGYRVYVLTRDKHSGNLFYPLDAGITFKHLRLKFSRLRRIIGQITCNLIPYFNRELYVAKIIRKFCDEIRPDVMIAMGIQDLADIIYHSPYPCQKIVQLHNPPSVFFTKKKTKLFVKTLKQADVVQVLMPSFKQMLKTYYTGKTVAIGNPVQQNKITRDKKKIIIYSGRIELEQKRPHLLIEAFAKIAPQFPDWQVHFYGGKSDEEYYNLCVHLIQKYHLEKQVKLMGVSQDMPNKLAEASICAFPSAFEGFSLALSEAMASGLPCVGFKDAISVNEMIKQGENGFLVKDIHGFAEALKTLMEDKDLREKMGKNSLDFIKNYSEDKILAQIEKLFI